MPRKSMYRRFVAGAAASACLAFHASGSAQTISYDSSHLGGTRWQYSFVLETGNLTSNVDEFTLYFERLEYRDLTLVDAPMGWDMLVVQSDAALPADGFVDGISPVVLSSMAAVGPFVVSFDYVGSNTPGSQRFELYDTSTFTLVGSGFTVPSPIPEPHSLLLFAAGLVAVGARFNRHTQVHLPTKR